ncbi:MAG: hypothetical protein CBD88_00895 [Flavobacteriales bacterium TMED228]|nr:MAG: hypothetical protein CBD88_00895 [Flavobacteriales bacterium TMED228]
MSDMKITINSKEYDYDCLDSFAKEQIEIITEVKREIVSLTNKIKILKASEIELTRQLSYNLDEGSIRKKQIAEPEQGS